MLAEIGAALTGPQEHLDPAITEFRVMKMQRHLERELSRRDILRA